MASHGGTVAGYKSYMGFLPGRGFGFAILANQSGAKCVEAAAYSLIDEALGLGESDWIAAIEDISKHAKARMERKVRETINKAKTVDAPESCFGAYRHPAYGRLAIKGSTKAPILVFEDKYKFSLNAGAADDFGFMITGYTAVPCHFDFRGGKVESFSAKLEDDAKPITYSKISD
jgi:hypothetical protein